MSIAINSNSWHAKWFRYSNAVWRAFGLDCSNVLRTNKTTVCHYLRTIIAYVPLVVALHIFTIGYIIFTFVFYPLTAFGMVPYLIAVGVVVGVILSYLSIDFIAKKYEKSQWSIKVKRPKREKTRVFASLGSLVWEFVKGMKQKVCPIVDLKEKLDD